jgi:hypothetical protein
MKRLVVLFAILAAQSASAEMRQLSPSQASATAIALSNQISQLAVSARTDRTIDCPYDNIATTKSLLAQASAGLTINTDSATPLFVLDLGAYKIEISTNADHTQVIEAKFMTMKQGTTNGPLESVKAIMVPDTVLTCGKRQ